MPTPEELADRLLPPRQKTPEQLADELLPPRSRAAPPDPPSARSRLYGPPAPTLADRLRSVATSEIRAALQQNRKPAGAAGISFRDLHRELARRETALLAGRSQAQHMLEGLKGALTGTGEAIAGLVTPATVRGAREGGFAGAAAGAGVDLAGLLAGLLTGGAGRAAVNRAAGAVLSRAPGLAERAATGRLGQAAARAGGTTAGRALGHALHPGEVAGQAVGGAGSEAVLQTVEPGSTREKLQRIGQGALSAAVLGTGITALGQARRLSKPVPAPEPPKAPNRPNPPAVGDAVLYTTNAGNQIPARVTAVHPDGTFTTNKNPRGRVGAARIRPVDEPGGRGGQGLLANRAPVDPMTGEEAAALFSTGRVAEIRKEKDALRKAGYPPDEVRRVVNSHLDVERYRELEGEDNVYLVMPSTSGENRLPDAMAERLRQRYGGEVVVGFARPLQGLEAKKRPILDKITAPASYELTEDLARLAGKNVVLVDDVLTTGDSVGGVRRALASSGIEAQRLAVLGSSDPYLVRPTDLDALARRLAEKTGADYNQARELVERRFSGEYRGLVRQVIRSAGEEENARVLYDHLTREGAAVPGNAGGAEALQRLDRPRPQAASRAPLRSGGIPGVPKLAATPGAPGLRAALPGPEVAPESLTARRNPPDPNAPPRVVVAPIESTTAKPLPQILQELNRNLQHRVERGRTGRGMLGTFFPSSGRTVVRSAGDLDTAAHEVAHYLDDRFGLGKDWAGARQRAPFDDEILAPVFQHTAGRSWTLAHRRAEGIAEWTAAWVKNPDEARRLAPKFTAHFEQRVPAEVRAALGRFSQDVRAWAGAPAGERIGSNIQMSPRAAGPGGLAGVRERIGRFFQGEGFVFETTGWDRVRASLLDSLHPVMKGIGTAKRLRGLGELLPESDPETLIRLQGGFLDRFQQMWERGLVDAQDRPVTPGGYRWLLEPLTREPARSPMPDATGAPDALARPGVLPGTGPEAPGLAERSAPEVPAESLQPEPGAPRSEEEIQRGMAETVRLMVAERIVHEAEASGDPLRWRGAGVGGGLFQDYVTARAHLADLQADPAKLRQLEEAAARYRQWTDSLLQYMVDRGRLTQEAAERIRADNPKYVDMHRVLDDLGAANPFQGGSGGFGRAKLGRVAQPLKEFRGSSRQIQNPYVGLMEQTFRIVRETDRNEALRAFRDLLHRPRGLHQGPLLDLASIGRQVSSDEPDAIKIFVKGKAEHWKFESGVQEALKGWMDLPEADVMLYKGIAGFMRSMITNNPAFALRNVIRDTPDRVIKSEAGSRIGDLFRGGLQGLGEQEFKLTGGGQAGFYLRRRQDWYRELDRVTREVSGDPRTIVTTLEGLNRAYGRMLERAELSNRLAEYHAARRQFIQRHGPGTRSNLSGEQLERNARMWAASQARGLLDFQVAGHRIRRVNQYVPFLNAAVQGGDRLVRAAKRDLKGVAARWAATLAVPTAIVWAQNQRDPDTREEYRQLDPRRRHLFWNVKIGPDTWLAIPRPYEAGVLASAVELTLDAAAGNRRAWEKYPESLAHSMIPVDWLSLIPMAVQPLFEVAANADLYRDRPLVPPHESQLELTLREGTQHASRLGQLGQRLTLVDARNVDHLIRQTFGWAGGTATSISDVGRADRPRNPVTQVGNPLTGLFRGSPASVARDVQWVMDWARRWDALQSPRIRALVRLQRRVYESKTNEERDRAARALRERATAIRQTIEKR